MKNEAWPSGVRGAFGSHSTLIWPAQVSIATGPGGLAGGVDATGSWCWDGSPDR